MIRRPVAVCALALIAALSAAHRVGAQQVPPPPKYAEYGVDAIVARGTSVQAGGGLVIPFGYYVRFGIDGGAGATMRDGATRASGRVDAIARFTLDPFREVPIGLSLGGGVTVPYVEGDAHVRPLLAAVVDIEGKRHGRFTPAIELGVGGGARLGFVLRASPPNFR